MASAEELPSLQIINWPVRQQPRFVCLALSFILVVAVGTIWVADSSIAGLLALIVLLLTTWRIWIPVRYELDARGVQEVVWRHRSKMPWSRVTRFELDPNGVLLLHQRDAFPLSALRGIYIHSPENHEELVSLVKFYAGL